METLMPTFTEVVEEILIRRIITDPPTHSMGG